MIILTIIIILSWIVFIASAFLDENEITLISFIIFVFSALILLFIMLNTKENKEQPTREVDYSIILIPFSKIEITNKHGNRDTIQFDSLQQYIELDNL